MVLDTLNIFLLKVDKIYLGTPTKIAILDHERKRTFVLRKDGLPDAGELCFPCAIILSYPFLKGDRCYSFNQLYQCFMF